ncbi:MAG: tail fiber domain-containing protein [Bacteroidota bacterium]
MVCIAGIILLCTHTALAQSLASTQNYTKLSQNYMTSIQSLANKALLMNSEDWLVSYNRYTMAAPGGGSGEYIENTRHTSSDWGIDFYTDAQRRMQILVDKINMNLPLEVDSNIALANNHFLRGRRSDGTISHFMGYSGNRLEISTYSTVPDEVRIYAPSDSGQGVNIYSDQSIAFFKNDGMVGIGTDDPDEKLHVEGSIQIENGHALKGKRIGSEVSSNLIGYQDDIVEISEYTTEPDEVRLYTPSGPGDGVSVYSDQTVAFFRNDGNVGIGTASPNYTLHVNGNAGKPGGGQWTNASDRRLKQDIKPFTDGLEFIKQINPVWYRYNGIADLPTEAQYVGVIAQEMQEIAPYTVSTFTHENEKGNTATYLEYDGSAVTYMLINAVKEQQTLIEEQQKELEVLRDMVYGVATKLSNVSTESIDSKEAQSASKDIALHQNIPNPFNRSTKIQATVPETVQQAKIVVYNLNGLELESYAVATRGNVSVKISGGRFPSGMYLYALVADGKVIDTKKMLLTK